jgi:lipopolysaccharide export system permease protein
MSANELAVYTRHLQENKQETERFKIAFWKKLFDPLAIFVLMALALPFGYLHTRSGGVSLKIFIGIMIGVSFLLVNTLFSHLGLLSTWPAFLTALRRVLFLLLALGACGGWSGTDGVERATGADPVCPRRARRPGRRPSSACAT